MRCILILVAIATLTLNFCNAKNFKKCELAVLLQNKHNFRRVEVKNWVCIAEYESTFNSSAINHMNWDGSEDFGLFQLNNKYWCGDESGQNVCKKKCEEFLDDDLTDDIACAKLIKRDTERWKKTNNGLVAWVAYVKRCQRRNLDEYISECNAALNQIPTTVAVTITPPTVAVTTTPPTVAVTTTTSTTISTTLSTTTAVSSSATVETTTTVRSNPVRGPQIPIRGPQIPIRGIHVPEVISPCSDKLSSFDAENNASIKPCKMPAKPMLQVENKVAKPESPSITSKLPVKPLLQSETKPFSSTLESIFSPAAGSQIPMKPLQQSETKLFSSTLESSFGPAMGSQKPMKPLLQSETKPFSSTLENIFSPAMGSQIPMIPLLQSETKPFGSTLESSFVPAMGSQIPMKPLLQSETKPFSSTLESIFSPAMGSQIPMIPLLQSETKPFGSTLENLFSPAVGSQVPTFDLSDLAPFQRPDSFVPPRTRPLPVSHHMYRPLPFSGIVQHQPHFIPNFPGIQFSTSPMSFLRPRPIPFHWKQSFLQNYFPISRSAELPRPYNFFYRPSFG